ncbi:hypothetical protein PTW35_24270 (plasmid) [Photobacterium sp. DA100]|uniref:hypothetical protein n=1 Tax=Photobacterium sp. DA100 TaxID=3027472 RepID=UPI00247948DC|nr:hypothetical protein [Photobacterium sp. DA100]WEM44393.1 hypothetical protein PTW35_24270 [Photobacterium sp. DA100]
MKRLTRLIIASSLGVSALVTHASIGFLNIDSLGLASLTDDEMSSLRGGFVSINDNIINIGLSVTTQVNGETVLNTHVADFTISNGILTSHDGMRTYDYDDPLKIISVGENNIINTSGTQDAVGFVVQNSADNTAIKTETVLDIDADIQGFNRQNLFNNRLEHALLHSGY